MKSRTRIQLVFAKHTLGRLANRPNLPPPVGLLTMAALLSQSNPGWDIEVYDENSMADNRLVDCLDAEIIGFGNWFSNYERSKNVALAVKKKTPDSTIVFGGPHTSGIAERILNNNSYIDIVIIGDGEIAMKKIAEGKPIRSIPGAAYRDLNDKIRVNEPKNIALAEIPAISLKFLKSPYSWDKKNESILSAFPISGMRGCFRKVRCPYCSIPTLGLRTKSPEQFWQEIFALNSKYGIDYFFETGDTFIPSYAKKLLSVTHPKVKFHIYSYPGIFNQKNIHLLKSLNVKSVFLGIESALLFEKKIESRQYKKGYQADSAKEEIQLYTENGIEVMPAFIFGLPGETTYSLDKNIELVEQISKYSGVGHLLLNTPLPLPGSKYFSDCVSSSTIVNEYNSITKTDLRKTDNIDYYLLSRLFVEEFSSVKYSTICQKIQELNKVLGIGVGGFGIAV